MNPAETKAKAKVDPTKTKMVLELKHGSPLIAGRFDPTGRFVFVAAQDNSIQRFDLSGKGQTAFGGHDSWARALGFTPDGKVLFSAGYDGRLVASPAQADKPAPLWTVDAHDGWVRALAVSPNGKTVATCGNDALVKLWSAGDGKALRAFAGHESHVYNVAIGPDGKSLVSGDLKGNVKQWDLATGKLQRDLDAKVLHKYDNTFWADIGGIRSMAFSRDGGLLACAGITNVSNAFAGVGNPVIVLFDMKTGKSKQALKPKADFRGTAWGVAFHPEGFLAGAAGGNGGALWFWKPDQAESFHMVKLPNNARDLDLHPDGRRLAIPFYDGVVRIYDMAPGT